MPYQQHSDSLCELTQDSNAIKLAIYLIEQQFFIIEKGYAHEAPFRIIRGTINWLLSMMLITAHAINTNRLSKKKAEHRACINCRRILREALKDAAILENKSMAEKGIVNEDIDDYYTNTTHLDSAANILLEIKHYPICLL